MKRFMFLSIGLLCLSLSALISIHVGHDMSQASVSDAYGIAFFDAPLVLDINGEVWNVGSGGGYPIYCWEHRPEFNPPSSVPVESIAYWANSYLIQHDGTAWQRISPGEWHNCGPWPGSPVPTDNSSWGAIKGTLEGSD